MSNFEDVKNRHLKKAHNKIEEYYAERGAINDLRYSELKARLDKIEGNDLHDLDKLHKDIEELYIINKDIVEIKKWIATQKSLKIQP